MLSEYNLDVGYICQKDENNDYCEIIQGTTGIQNKLNSVYNQSINYDILNYSTIIEDKKNSSKIIKDAANILNKDYKHLTINKTKKWSWARHPFS